MASLYVAEQGAVVAKSGGRIVVRRKDKLLATVPSAHLDRIVAFGNVHFTTPTITFALKQGIDIVFLSSRGSYRGRLQSPWSKDGKLRYLQYSAYSNAQVRLLLAKAIVRGKILNAAALCARQETSAEGRKYARQLRALAKRANQVQDLASLRGIEGAASLAYFQAYRSFLKHPQGFPGRRRRPPTDPINALLSLGYTLLYTDMYAMVSMVGLDPYLGLFHQPAHGHAALVSDLIEEWRPTIVDALVLLMLNRADFCPVDFRVQGDGTIRLTKEALRRFVKQYEQRLARVVDHPRLGKRLSYRQCLEAQVRHLVAFFQGRIPAYQPFRTR